MIYFCNKIASAADSMRAARVLADALYSNEATLNARYCWEYAKTGLSSGFGITTICSESPSVYDARAYLTRQAAPATPVPLPTSNLQFRSFLGPTQSSTLTRVTSGHSRLHLLKGGQGESRATQHELLHFEFMLWVLQAQTKTWKAKFTISQSIPSWIESSPKKG